MPHALPRSCLASTGAGPTETFAHLDDKGIARERADGPQLSPIDRAFGGLVVVTQIAAQHELDWQSQHGLMLSASAVAVAEDYFRTILTDSVVTCPVCLGRVSGLSTRMEFVRSGSVADALRAALDHSSLSSRDGVREWTKTLTGLDIGNATAVGRALKEYELVCHVRHCAVHSGGYVGAHNAAVLGVPAGSWISFSAPGAVHSIVAVITRTVRAFNQSLFEHILGQWIDAGILQGDWSADRVPFSALWQSFSSRTDAESARLSNEPGFHRTGFNAYRSIRQAVRRRQTVLT